MKLYIGIFILLSALSQKQIFTTELTEDYVNTAFSDEVDTLGDHETLLLKMETPLEKKHRLRLAITQAQAQLANKNGRQLLKNKLQTEQAKQDPMKWVHENEEFAHAFREYKSSTLTLNEKLQNALASKDAITIMMVIIESINELSKTQLDNILKCLKEIENSGSSNMPTNLIRPLQRMVIDQKHRLKQALENRENDEKEKEAQRKLQELADKQKQKRKAKRAKQLQKSKENEDKIEQENQQQYRDKLNIQYKIGEELICRTNKLDNKITEEIKAPIKYFENKEAKKQYIKFLISLRNDIEDIKIEFNNRFEILNIFLNHLHKEKSLHGENCEFYTAEIKKLYAHESQLKEILFSLLLNREAIESILLNLNK